MGEGVAGFFKFSWTIAAFFQECVSNRNGPKHYTRMIIIENKRTQSEEKLVRWRSKTESRLVESCFTSFRPSTSTPNLHQKTKRIESQEIVTAKNDFWHQHPPIIQLKMLRVIWRQYMYCIGNPSTGSEAVRRFARSSLFAARWELPWCGSSYYLHPFTNLFLFNPSKLPPQREGKRGASGDGWPGTRVTERERQTDRITKFIVTLSKQRNQNEERQN